MIFLLFLFFQDIEIENQVSISAIANYSDSRGEVKFKEVLLKGPDPYYLAVSNRNETEFVALMKIAHIVPDPDRINWYTITFFSGEEIKGQIRGVTFKAVTDDENKEKVTFRLRDLERLSLSSGEQMKSCPNCEYENNSSFWYCPRCGHELNLGSFEVNERKESRQTSSIRYRLDTRDQ
ncbi:MAG: hypothetical protein CSA81_05345 [Acidobacteria bacterium]|nr:MAG: hypothetical protein CSA81_05345 [Acidobacteriota bacterium]PIE90987.1 MAG: hypothetical protein CR997_03765 [Acidobacteriota bacterium]